MVLGPRSGSVRARVASGNTCEHALGPVWPHVLPGRPGQNVRAPSKSRAIVRFARLPRSTEMTGCKPVIGYGVFGVVITGGVIAVTPGTEVVCGVLSACCTCWKIEPVPVCWSLLSA